MKTFTVYAGFKPTIEITARVDPFNEAVIDPTGFILLEGGAGFLLLENGDRILLESSIIPLTVDATIYTADDTIITADQTFILNVS